MTYSTSLFTAAALLALTACSSNDSDSNDSSVNCELVGCAKPPPCGQPCTEPCGCCPTLSARDCSDGAVDAIDDGASKDSALDVALDVGLDVKADVGASDLSMTFTDGGCLDWDSASRICGFKSDEAVCQLVVKCGFNQDVGQCQIDCEMGTTSGGCYNADDVSCLLDALAKESCDDLKACGWIL